MSKRQKVTFENRNLEEAPAIQPEQDDLLKKISQADGAPELYGWVNSQELQPPK
jgi:hypothetical protein